MNRRFSNAVETYFKDRGATVSTQDKIPTRDNTDYRLQSPDGVDLIAFVKSISPGCKDIIIYLSSHGGDAPRATVTVGERWSVTRDKQGRIATETKVDADVKSSDIARSSGTIPAPSSS
jgi:hypothetical protein